MRVTASLVLGSAVSAMVLTSCGGDPGKPAAQAPAATAPAVPAVSTATYHAHLNQKCAGAEKAIKGKLPTKITNLKDLLDFTEIITSAERALLKTLPGLAGPPAAKEEVRVKYLVPATRVTEQALADVRLLRTKISPSTASQAKAALARLTSSEGPAYDGFLRSNGLSKCTSTGR